MELKVKGRIVACHHGHQDKVTCSRLCVFDRSKQTLLDERSTCSFVSRNSYHVPGIIRQRQTGGKDLPVAIKSEAAEKERPEIRDKAGLCEVDWYWVEHKARLWNFKILWLYIMTVWKEDDAKCTGCITEFYCKLGLSFYQWLCCEN